MRAKSSASLKMRKCSKNSRIAGNVSLLDVEKSSLGVLTRAKALALQRQKKDSSPVAATVDGIGGDYLQLRSRLLLKPSALSRDRKKRRKLATKETFSSNPNPNLRNSQISDEIGVQNAVFSDGKEETEIKEEVENANLCVEASFGENALDFDGRKRTTRESTPCSLVKEAGAMRTPGSTTNPTSAANKNKRLGSSSQIHTPTTREMNEFFTGPEKEQQKQFMDKYNFDPVNEKPLPGRYEWEKVMKP